MPTLPSRSTIGLHTQAKRLAPPFRVLAIDCAKCLLFVVRTDLCTARLDSKAQRCALIGEASLTAQWTWRRNAGSL